MSPYTAIPESTWHCWLREECPEVGEFMPRIIQRANCDSRNGRTARTFKSNGTEPSTCGVEQSPRECTATRK
jgi:hypothetical protein